MGYLLLQRSFATQKMSFLKYEYKIIGFGGIFWNFGMDRFWAFSNKEIFVLLKSNSIFEEMFFVL